MVALHNGKMFCLARNMSLVTDSTYLNYSDYTNLTCLAELRKSCLFSQSVSHLFENIQLNDSFGNSFSYGYSFKSKKE